MDVVARKPSIEMDVPDDPTLPYSKRLGNAGENAACHLLEEKGYLLLERNWLAWPHEVDIIAQHRDILVFVEVKTRSSVDYGEPWKAVDDEKLYSLQQAIGVFRKTHPGYRRFNYRIDVVSAVGDLNHLEVEHFIDPFRKRLSDKIPAKHHYFNGKS